MAQSGCLGLFCDAWLSPGYLGRGEVLWGGAGFLEEQLEPLLSGAVRILHETKGGTQGKF